MFPIGNIACVRRLLRLGAALIVLSPNAFAEDPDSVKAPFVEVGDCWSYRGQSLYNRGYIDGYELCVTLVDAARNLIAAVATVKSDKREIDILYTLQWRDARGITGTISVPPAEFLRFPMRVGDKYTVQFDYRGPVTSFVPGRQVYDVEVAGWEDVVVPAGSFRALKIVGRGWVTATGFARDTGMKRTWWYVPEINRHVKYSVESVPNTFSEELTGFRLLK